MTLLQVISKIENVEGLKPVTQTTQPQLTQVSRFLHTNTPHGCLCTSEELRGVGTRVWRGRQNDSESVSGLWVLTSVTQDPCGVRWHHGGPRRSWHGDPHGEGLDGPEDDDQEDQGSMTA